MVKEIFTMYDIGDTVWSTRYPEDWTNIFEHKLGVHQDEIAYIRVFFDKDGSSKVQYFLKGLSSYEGENWFDELPDEDDWEAIFPTKEEAYEHLLSIFEDDYDKYCEPCD